MILFQRAREKQFLIGVWANVEIDVHSNLGLAPGCVHLDVYVQMDYTKLLTTDVSNMKNVHPKVSQEDCPNNGVQVYSILHL